jgi:hypothetical protein
VNAIVKILRPGSIVVGYAGGSCGCFLEEGRGRKMLNYSRVEITLIQRIHSKIARKNYPIVIIRIYHKPSINGGPD